MIKPDHDVAEVMDRVKERGVLDVHQIGRLHILLTEMDSCKMKRIAAIPGVSSVTPDRVLTLPPHGQPH